MPKRPPSSRAMLAVCDEIGPEDGVDPRQLAKARMNQHKTARFRSASGSTPEPAGRKPAQLARQVAEALELVLSGDARDARLQDLRVVSVVPAPDASRLLVTVAPRSPSSSDPVEILHHFERASPWLRTEVAGAITRKRAPVLAFVVAPGEV